MPFVDRVLEAPSYGWQDAAGNLITPSRRELVAECFSSLNIFASRKHWVAFLAWFNVLCLVPFFVLFVFKYFTWWGLVVGFVYSMILMGTHGTIWYHRYSTHGAFTFRNRFWRIVTQNLVIKVLPEETYVVSHHVHHAKSDEPGDPYNAKGGFLYCFLADTNHQRLALDLDPRDYACAALLLQPCGTRLNTYALYQRWGSISSPYRTALAVAFNWAFWYAAFYVIGGTRLAVTIFGSALVWAVGVRTFNYGGHGKGTDQRVDGVDFSRSNLSINQLWPGIVAGEWHSNHHLFPTSARAGFLPHQIDVAWCYIYLLYLVGGITSYRDSKHDFLQDYYHPYRAGDDLHIRRNGTNE
jgi:stearoyl-CoA desaturase (delta-9 desaturase)